MKVDLVVRDARIRTLSPAQPIVDRLAVRAGRVVAIADDVDGLSAEETISAHGATILPGFNDAHSHPVMLGNTLEELDLSDGACQSLEDLYMLVEERARQSEPGSWIIGCGYDQNRVGGHPSRKVLDQIAPRHFVWLKHASAHMCVVNTPVLEAAGLLDGTAILPAGGVVRLETGLLEEQAQRFVRALVWPLSEEQIARSLARASELAVSQGVTSWTDAGVGGGWIGHAARELGGYQLARQSGRLPVRTTAMIVSDCLHELQRSTHDRGDLGIDLGIRSGFGDDVLRIGALKVFADGSLLGRTAAMCCEYTGDPDNVGYLQDDPQRIRETIVQAHLAGWQVATHAIGDRAIDVVLDALEEAQRRLPRPDARHRIEHAGVVTDAQLRRMVQLAVVPVPQGEFVSAMGDAMVHALGPDRSALLYRQKSFIEAGLVVPGSSDRPVVPGAPLVGIRDLILRRTASGSVLSDHERLDLTQALRAWTVGSAFAEHAESGKGTLMPGMLADFVVLERDPYDLDPADLPDLEVLGTFVGGTPVFGALGTSQRADQVISTTNAL